ncbi:unnamed protein product [Paramecium sonneborni]|uniref:Uncharacterized protein n=1 Tax=Paramecium sonneborni TaxID=65129 RepID=A0A8S1KR06_9CILI|nr:unnamed protein product [Paramecium sonneborni]
MLQLRQENNLEYQYQQQNFYQLILQFNYLLNIPSILNCCRNYIQRLHQNILLLNDVLY